MAAEAGSNEGGTATQTRVDVEPASRFTDYLASLRQLHPVHANRASDLGFPCDRYNWYQRTQYQAAALPDIRLQGIFEYGKDYETALLARLRAAGYLIRSEQITREWKEYNITGHPEGKICFVSQTVQDGMVVVDFQRWYPFEIKGIHTYYYDKVKTWRDFLTMGPIYARYPAQIQMYLLLENEELGYFIIGRKGTYDVKFLPVELDYDLAESYLKKAERINRMVEHGPEPDRTDDREVCGVCAFKLTCLPPEEHGPGAQMWQDESLLAKLRRRDELSETAREYTQLDQEIKASVKGHAMVLIGDYRIDGKEQTRKGYEVPAATFWRTTITNLKTSGGEL